MKIAVCREEHTLRVKNGQNKRIRDLTTVKSACPACGKPYVSYLPCGSVIREEGTGSLGAPTLVYSARTAAGDVWRTPTRLMLKIHLTAGAQTTEMKILDRLPTGKT